MKANESRDTLPPELSRALRELPRERAAADFTEGVLARLDRPESASEEAPTRSPARFPRLPSRLHAWLSVPRWDRLAAGSALAALTLAAALAIAGPVRERVAERERAERLRALDAERARIANELAEIRRLSEAPLPVVYVGGDDDVDGEGIEGTWDLSLAIRGKEAGENADLTVWRGGSSLDFRVAVEEREREQVHLEKMLRFAPGAEWHTKDGETAFPKGLTEGEGPHVFHWRGEGGEAPTVFFDTEGLVRLEESLGEVDWPRLEGRLRTDRNRELEERLKKLEKQLAELEKALRESERRNR